MLTYRTEMSDLCISFQKNLNEETTKLLFTEEELDGLPESFMKGIEKVSCDGVRRVVSSCLYCADL